MSAEKPVEIRRYPNRRLYDRSRRRYVTLQDIETLVLEGNTVDIRDSKTGEDLTRQILTQILAERHPAKMEMFPVAMLHNILRANDMATEVWRGYLRQSLAAIESWQRAAIPFASPMDWMSAFLPALSPTAQESPGPAPAAGAAARRLDELAARVERLENSGGVGQGAARGPDPLVDMEERVDRLEQKDKPRAGKSGKARRS